MRDLTSNEVYSAEERKVMLTKMQQTSNAFYAAAVRIGCHPFIEFCGLMNEYIKVCTAAHEAGIDFTQTTAHSGLALPMQKWHVEYLAEKLECIYGPALQQNDELQQAFLSRLGLTPIHGAHDKEATS